MHHAAYKAGFKTGWKEAPRSFTKVNKVKPPVIPMRFDGQSRRDWMTGWKDGYKSARKNKGASGTHHDYM